MRGGSGLLVDAELVRAIRSESALAIGYWFGGNGETVWRLRGAFGVEGHAGTEGSRVRRAAPRRRQGGRPAPKQKV